MMGLTVQLILIIERNHLGYISDRGINFLAHLLDPPF